MSDFHGRILNLRANDSELKDDSPPMVLAYKTGHRDARHAAAAIANEADGQIEAAEGMAHLLELLIQSEVIGGLVAKKAEKMLAAWAAAKEQS